MCKSFKSENSILKKKHEYIYIYSETDFKERVYVVKELKYMYLTGVHVL